MIKKYKILIIPIITFLAVHINKTFASNENICNNLISKSQNKIYFIDKSINYNCNSDIKIVTNEIIPPKTLIDSANRLEQIFNIKKEFILSISRIESNYKQIHSPYYNSTANGPYQFTENGWKGDIDLCKKSNKIPKVNISNIYNIQNRINYKKSSFILACAMSAIKDKIESKYGNDNDKYAILYMNHFLGVYDTERFEEIISKNPNKLIIKIFNKDKIEKNKTLFYINGQKTTALDVFNNIKKIIKKQIEDIKIILYFTQKNM